MAIPVLPLVAGGIGALALRNLMKRKRKTAQERGMEVGDVTGDTEAMRYGGKVKKMAMGGKVTRGDGACMKGHTKGRVV